MIKEVLYVVARSVLLLVFICGAVLGVLTILALTYPIVH